MGAVAISAVAALGVEKEDVCVGVLDVHRQRPHPDALRAGRVRRVHLEALPAVNVQ